MYHNGPKLSDTQVWANNADPDQTAPQSDQSLHCLPFCLQRLDALLNGKSILVKFLIITEIFWVSRFLGVLR